jgi:hypothetical protein
MVDNSPATSVIGANRVKRKRLRSPHRKCNAHKNPRISISGQRENDRIAAVAGDIFLDRIY